MKRILLSLLSLILLAVNVPGSPARRGVFPLIQPDGTVFLAKLEGDEFCRILTTQQGHAIALAKDGFYQYAYYNQDGSKECSGYRVGEQTPSLILAECMDIPYRRLGEIALEKRRAVTRQPFTRSATTRATTRTCCAVLLVQFPDLQFQGSSRKEDYSKLLNGIGNGSALEYFNDQFQGQYDFNFVVGDIVTVSKNHDYYGSNDSEGNDAHAVELVREACTLSDASIDFSQLDGDGDGKVDNVFVFVAGKSEAEGGGEEFIWPHQWYLQNNLTLDGKRIETYAIATELSIRYDSSTGRYTWVMGEIGTFCHEYSHTLGLFDMYDTDGKDSGGSSDALWYSTSIMDGGCYNNNGRTPPYYDSIDRECLGIGKPEPLHSGTWTLEPVSRNGRYAILENPNDPYEFFLFECRDNDSWDAYIGGSGLAIYHVDMTERKAGYSDYYKREVTAIERWYYNEVNANPSFQCADMIETGENVLSVSQAFFPYKNRNSFSPETSPAFRFNDGQDADFFITDIKRSGSNVTFKVHSSKEVVPNVTNAKYETYQDAAIITWQSDIEEYEGPCTVTWGETSGSKTEVQVQPYAPGKFAIRLEDLSPTTSYTAEVQFVLEYGAGESATVDFLTRSYKEENKPYIYLEYLYEQREGGKFAKDAGLPLVVYNAVGQTVSWFFDGSPIRPDASGYYHPAKSGILKATVDHKDGTRTILNKQITLQ
ncbi:MAG: M6 family metalloprotease domain-containing protein [Bacteroidales bacterium]|nr:M6 family metalloprotease domain-containing protein [Bacteroidales bacterium]